MGAEGSKSARRGNRKKSKPKEEDSTSADASDSKPNATENKRETGNKRRRKNGQFCGTKGKVCGAIGCNLCWVWCEERDDCTIKVNAELMDKLDKKDRKEVDSMNAGIAALYKQQQDGKDTDGKLDQAIAVMQCDLAITVENALCQLGMEKAVPTGMMDKIGKFARPKSADDTVVVISDTLRRSMTEHQLKEFKRVNQEHKAIQIAYEKPQEALADIRVCTYLLLFAFAHQNGFDFSQDPKWPKPPKQKGAKTFTKKKGKKTY
jgi:hypothetical protein